MRTQRDYYEILGLPRTASEDEIKKRYRELARKYHPDMARDNQNSHRIFAQVAEAYNTLIDPDKRAEYDRQLSGNGNEPAAGAQQPASRPSYEYATGPQVQSLIEAAKIAVSTTRWKEASESLRQALDIERTNPVAHAMLGDVYQKLGKPGPALTEYLYAVQYNPSDAESKRKAEKLKKMDPAKMKPAQSGSHPAKANGKGNDKDGGDSLLGKLKSLFSK